MSKSEVSTKSLEHRFYVYALLAPRKPGEYVYGWDDNTIRFTHEPFYVGKGTRSRWSDHYTQFPGTNPHKERKIKKN